jgi:hypothetical protein
MIFSFGNQSAAWLLIVIFSLQNEVHICERRRDRVQVGDIRDPTLCVYDRRLTRSTVWLSSTVYKTKTFGVLGHCGFQIRLMRMFTGAEHILC